MAWVVENVLEGRTRLAWFELAPVRVVGRDAALEAAIEQRVATLREAFDSPAAAAPCLAAGRRLYRGLGIDPTKHRPSSEALLRRVLSGKGLYRVNTAVDAANLTSLSHHLPVGLYDADRLVSSDATLRFRTGAEGEGYAGIGKGRIHLSGRPTLADDSGPFGNPSADSFRTRVTLATRRLLFVIFAPADIGAGPLAAHRELSLQQLSRFVGGAQGEDVNEL